MSQPRKTKIVATIGPASADPQVLSKIIAAGLDVARLNFSHGDHASHQKTMDLVRRLAAEQGRTVAILQDLAGPKIRLGDLPEPMWLEAGQEVELTPRLQRRPRCAARGLRRLWWMTWPPVKAYSWPTGWWSLKVIAASGGKVRAMVKVGGEVSSRKGSEPAYQ